MMSIDTLERPSFSDTSSRRTEQARVEALHSGKYDGLHVRLLAAELSSLDPQKEISTDQVKQIGSFEDRNYVPYEKKLRKGRKKYWKQQVEKGEVVNTKKAIYAKWEKGLLHGVNKQLSTKQKQEIFYPLFKQAGIKKDDGNEKFTDIDAKKLYGHYFSTEKNKHSNPENMGAKGFIRDVMATFTKADGKPDEAAIREHLPMLEKFAGIFDEEDSAMLTQLLMAEVRWANDPAAVKNTPIDRISKPTKDEERILNLITEANRPPDLPVLRRKDEIKSQALTQKRILISAETGAGKTVGIPPLVRETLKPGEKILMTQPQQNTAISTPNHIAEEFSLRVGTDIGYISGGGVKCDMQRASIVVVTEMIALRQLLDRDEWSKDVRHILFDEAHKLSPEMEIMAALALEEQQRREREGGTPLSSWFISATADEKKFKNYADIDTPIKIEGRTFGNAVNFLETPLYTDEASAHDKSTKINEAAAKKAGEITNDSTSEKGDIIIAVAGEGEMKKIEELLRAQELQNVQIVKIRSDSTKDEKAELGKKAPPGIRRIIIGTDAMQTGVTVKGGKYVINTGDKKEPEFDPITGMTYIHKVQQSQAEARQWEGRVGRTSKGHVFHLMTQDEFEDRPDQPTAPIHRTDIAGYVLLLRAAGRDMRELKLLSGNLDEDRVKGAEETLQKLGALDAEGNATDMGKRMSQIPTNYHMARAIAQAEKENKGIKQMYALAAILEVAKGKEGSKHNYKILNNF